MDNHYTLYQLDDEHGDLFLNSGPDPLPLIDAGRKLATWTDADFAVNCKDDLVWSSREPKKGVHFQLVRSEGAVSILILPGSYAEGLIKTGQLLAEQHPEWTLEVQDKKLRAIWTTKKSAPGKAEDTTQNGWWLKRNGGDHDIYTNGTDCEPISRQREIKETVAQEILRWRGLK